MQLIDHSTGKLTKRARFADWLGRWVLPPFALGTAVFGAFLTFNWADAAKQHPGMASFYGFCADWIGWAFAISAISTFLLTVLQTSMRPSLRALQSKVDFIGENFRALCDGFMSDLATKLGIGQGDQSRASIYVHDGNGKFVLCGRYSPNPDFKRPGRPSYPDNEGCIGRGWRDGWWYENRLGRGAVYYNNTERRYGMARATAQALPMKSLLFGVQRIDHGDSCVGLIVVESLREDRFPEDALRAELEQAARDFAPALKALGAYAPTPAVARNRGF